MIMDTKTIQNSIVVGDLQKALIVYDFKEGRNMNSKNLVETAHANDTIWVKKVLALDN